MKLSAQSRAILTKGVRDKSFRVNAFPNLKCDKPNVTQVTNGFGNGFKSDFQAHRWKKDRVETKETIEEMEHKAKRIGIAYNKGAYQGYRDWEKI